MTELADQGIHGKLLVYQDMVSGKHLSEQIPEDLRL